MKSKPSSSGSAVLGMEIGRVVLAGIIDRVNVNSYNGNEYSHEY